MKKSKFFLFVFVVLFVVVYFPLTFVFAQLSIEEFNTLRITGEGIVDLKGNLHVNLDWKIPTNALYTEIKRNFPNPYVILREFASGRAAFEVANAKIEYDDAERALHLTADFLGAAVNKRGRWEIDMGKGTDCIWMEGQRAIFLQIFPIDSQMIQIMDMMINLPQEASSVKYDEKKGLLTYSLPKKPAAGYCELELSFKCKPRLMAATYKAYGNPDISNGSMWVAKAVFKNSGECNIRNLKVSYKLGEYSDWSIPNTYSLVVPGGYVVDLYYPVISPKITQLLTRTPVDVRVKYSYQDEAGNKYEEVSGERIEILGINQIEFCNLTMEERTGTWAEYFSNSPLLAAWVTHLDPPVKALAGMVSQLAGGVPTSLDRESAIRFCKALYELEVANGMVYQTPSGFLEEYAPGQDIKYPRDVLRDKAGTCVDLAILYASVCEAVGLETILVLIPGHAFPVIILPNGELLPVECTAISGVAVGEPRVRALSFEKAVEFASKELQQLQIGKYYLVNVEQMWQKGVVSPELPRLEADILTRWGWQLPQRETQQVQREQPTQGQGVEQRTNGERGQEVTVSVNKRHSSQQHKCSFLYPEAWQIQETKDGINISEPRGLAWITMWNIAENVNPQTYLQNVEDYLKQTWQNYTVTSRSEVKINSIDALRVDGHYTPAQGRVEIFTILVLHQNNQAKLMVGSGIAKEQYANLSPVMEKIFNSIILADAGQRVTSQQTQQQTQKYTSEQYKFSFDYPQGWQVTERQGTVSVVHPQNLAWVSIWRITQNVDPQNYLQNLEFQLRQQYQNFTVTERKQATINGINVLIAIAESTSPHGQAQVNGILVFHENNQAKLGVVSAGLKEKYANLSPLLNQIIGSITLR